MKKQWLQIGSLLMAWVVLFVSMGWDIKFHYCHSEHHLSSSFGETATETCLHCLSHDHEHESNFAKQNDVIHYESKCCCDDFDSRIQFTDNFVFSTEKHLNINLQSFVLPHFDLTELCDRLKVVFNHHSPRKTFKFLSGQELIVFFSSLKLNPLVF